MIIKKTSPKKKAIAAPDELTFMAMFDRQSAIVLLLEPQTGRILDVNQAALDFYGYPKIKTLWNVDPGDHRFIRGAGRGGTSKSH
ncbi:MAG: PAS domain-containing protein [Anaerolineales bacterium]|nr:PAS domain-containing protein [Anaerolineales bacterium]